MVLGLSLTSDDVVWVLVDEADGTVIDHDVIEVHEDAEMAGAAARIQADDASIRPPQSVTSLTCLDNFFNGSGLNVITSLLDPTALLNSIKGQLCNMVQSAWQSSIETSMTSPSPVSRLRFKAARMPMTP